MPNSTAYKFYLALCCLVLTSCSGPIPSLPPQSWADVQIEVQTRPSQAIAGMNEFIIIATREKRKVANNLLISLRINENGQWHQAIQDGHVGAYRKAMLVKNPQEDVLFVRIDYDDREGILAFPLKEQKVYPNS
jgi:hypothetical protein